MVSVRPVRGGDTRACDVVVLGAGIAGLVTALDLLDLAPGLSVTVIDKGGDATSGSSGLAQGGLAAAVGATDSAQRHAADTLAAGDGHCDPRAVAVLTAEGPARVEDLVARGAVFDRDPDGRFALAREAGQSVPRSVRAADATGAAIVAPLRARATGRVQRLQGTACALATAPSGDVHGVWLLLDDLDVNPAGPVQERGLALVSAPAVVLATGGCGGLYAATTNHDDATGDGVALAAVVGAELVDMEFVQFHPTGLKEAGLRRLLLTEALRGAGAVLVDASGRRFMPGIHPEGELAPRHIVTKAILDQPGGAWLDATRLPAGVLEREFPNVLAAVRARGHDLAADPVPVEPCQHYMIGGVATDLWGRTTVPGLWAAGEVACTGAHGANRMAGNSLLESCVFARRTATTIVAALAGLRGDAADPDPPLAGAPPPDDLASLRVDLRGALSAGAGAVRTRPSLDAADKAIAAAQAALGSGTPALRHDALGLHSMLVAGRLIVRSARLRAESRGVHWREDAPGHHADWRGVRIRLQGAAPAGDS